MGEIPDQNRSQYNEKGSRFLRLFASVQPRLYGFVSTLVFNWADVEDVIQETSSVMWSKFDEFEPGTDFIAWTLRIAHYQVLAFYEKQKRQRRLSQQAIETIVREMMTTTESQDDHLDALRKCVSRLPEKDRTILHLRYEVGATAKSVSQRVGQNINTLYKNLSRIHTLLFHCMHRLKMEDHI